MRQALDRRLRRSRTSILFQALGIAVFVILMNALFELKDREIYRNFYGSLDSCQWAGCFLISNAVRSPIFLSLIIGGHRLGFSFDVTYTMISLLGVLLLTRAMYALPDTSSSTRVALISITLGTWLYLIQVKLFLAVALYLYARTRDQRWQKIAFAVASILTHESIMFFMALQFFWRPSEFRVSLRALLVLGALVALIVIYLGATSNVFLSALQRIQRYNEYAEVGVVPAMSRVGMYSVLTLLFAMIGLFRFRPTERGNISLHELKLLLWMFLPWLVFMALAFNELYAIRLSELAILHTLLVIPLASSYRYPSRLALLIFALTFGMLTLLRDVLFA